MSRARIRPGGPGDAAAILDLEKHFPGDRMSARSVRHLLRSPSARVLVAAPAAGTGLLGALILLVRKGSRLGRIYSVVVDPRARGQGLGRRLVERAQRSARAAGCDRMALEVRDDNAAARALYAGLGYAEGAKLPGYYEDGGDGLRLVRALGGGTG